MLSIYVNTSLSEKELRIYRYLKLNLIEKRNDLKSSVKQVYNEIYHTTLNESIFKIFKDVLLQSILLPLKVSSGHCPFYLVCMAFKHLKLQFLGS